MNIMINDCIHVPESNVLKNSAIFMKLRMKVI
jgi:hypothetical protein